jgi:hypothetical protein
MEIADSVAGLDQKDQLNQCLDEKNIFTLGEVLHHLTPVLGMFPRRSRSPKSVRTFLCNTSKWPQQLNVIHPQDAEGYPGDGGWRDGSALVDY